VIQVLEDYQRAWRIVMKAFQLQRASWCSRWAAAASSTGRVRVPVKHELRAQEAVPGDIGPSTGEMGTNDVLADPTRVSTRRSRK